MSAFVMYTQTIRMENNINELTKQKIKAITFKTMLLKVLYWFIEHKDEIVVREFYLEIVLKLFHANC